MKSTFWLAALLAMMAGRAEAAGYRYTMIVVPGAYATYGRAINDAGEVAGDYSTYSPASGYGFHCFTFKAGVISTFDPPGSSGCSGYGISANGTVAGTFDVAGERRQAGFVYKDGIFTTYGQPGYSTELFAESPNGTAIGSSTADRTKTSRIFEVKAGIELNEATAPYEEQFFYCVNDAGKAGGHYTTPFPSLMNKGLIYNKGKLSTAVVPGGNSVFVEGINASGTTVGVYTDTVTGLQHGFVNQRGTITTVLDPNRPESAVAGINDAGSLVGDGYSSTAIPPNEGFVIVGGVFSVVPPPPVAGITQFSVDGINNAGQITGGYFDASDDFISFVATPQ